jgi:uncharacterized protein
MNPIEQLSKQLNIPAKQVQKTIQLLEEGGTVPFISRYRKEQTGGLDERVRKEKANYHQSY